VQDKETLDRLRELGCDAAQGDYLSAPLDAPAVLRWLREREGHQVVQP
jgi:EAL domain-containing protein (putative c-di-GMP-specific phosphodiesterase class I)